MSEEDQRAGKQTSSEQSPEENLNGAAIIDKNGREVPITESMIVEAFDKIEKSDKA